MAKLAVPGCQALDADAFGAVLTANSENFEANPNLGCAAQVKRNVSIVSKYRTNFQIAAVHWPALQVDVPLSNR